MAVRLTDEQIGRLIQEEKRLPPNYLSRIQLKPKRGHKERELSVTGGDGSAFQLRIRQSAADSLDFSVILAYRPPNSNHLMRLKRYNGNSHSHTNPLEGQTFANVFHVHTATERYQENDLAEDKWAEPTDRFADLNSAIACMLSECGFVDAEDPQPSLFKAG